MGTISEDKQGQYRNEKKDETPSYMIILIVSIFLLSILYAPNVAYNYEKYYLDIDSYHFMRFAYHPDDAYDLVSHIAGALKLYTPYFFMVVVLGTVILWVAFSFSKKSLYPILFLMLSGLVYTHMKLNYIDKDIIIFFLWSMAIILFYIRDYWCMGISMMVMLFFWKGSIVFILIFFIIWLSNMFLFRGKDNKLSLIIFIIMLFLVSGLFYFAMKMKFIFNPGITETFNIFQLAFFPENILLFLLLCIGIAIYRKLTIDILVFSIFGFFFYCMMFRMNLFMLPFIIILFYEVMETLYEAEERKYSILYWALCILLFSSFIYNVGSGGYKGTMFMDKSIEDAMTEINIQNTNCLISDWGYGNIYAYYTNKTVYFHGHGFNDTIFKEKEYFIDGKNNTCSMIWKTSDIGYIRAMSGMYGFSMPETNYTDSVNKSCWKYKREEICIKSIVR